MFVLEKKKLTVFYDSAATVHAGIRPQDMACRRAVSIRLEKRTHSCFAKNSNSDYEKDSWTDENR
jgi:hypothetical protein